MLSASDAPSFHLVPGRPARLLLNRSIVESKAPMRAARNRIAKKEGMARLTALDDRELSEWVMALGGERSGHFLCALAEAVMKADAEDYSVIRPALMNLKRKYPDANSDPQGIPDAVTNRNQATRNPQGERRKGL
jgi:hypothetical protein